MSGTPPINQNGSRRTWPKVSAQPPRCCSISESIVVSPASTWEAHSSSLSSPRNFHHHGFWRHRTEGEIFWVIKHGSPGTSMIGLGSQLSDEEIWTVMRYLRTFTGGHGPRGGMGRRGPRDGDSECCSDQERTP